MKRPSLAEKATFNTEEAIAFYGFSRRKFKRLIETMDEVPFVAMYKNRKIIIRDELETFLRFRPELKEELKNGEPRGIPKKKGLEAPRSAER